MYRKVDRNNNIRKKEVFPLRCHKTLKTGFIVLKVYQFCGAISCTHVQAALSLSQLFICTSSFFRTFLMSASLVGFPL